MAIKDLEAKVAELEAEIEDVECYFEIMNVKSTYGHHSASSAHAAKETFAWKNPKVQVDIGGAYLGAEGVKRFFGIDQPPHPPTQTAFTGTFGIIFASTPVIERTKDRKIAKGLWVGWGLWMFPANPYPCDKEKLTDLWGWFKYDNSFVQEDGCWKLLSLRLVRLFRCPFNSSWVAQPDVRRGLFAPPDRMSTGLKDYHPHCYNVYLPDPPEPVD
jgi:hypothetical protein